MLKSSEHRCCFTGHRPEKIQEDEEFVKEKIGKAVDATLKSGKYTFLTGMARGVDTWAAEIVLEKKRRDPTIKLICVVPFANFDGQWAYKDKQRAKAILDQADFEVVISKKYQKGVYQARNKYMVDHCSAIIGVYNGQPSGTENTLKYAKEKGLKICIVKVHSKQ